MLVIEGFFIAFTLTFILMQFLMAGPRRVPMSEVRYRELRFRRLVEGGRTVRWEPYGRPMTSLAWA